MANSNDETLTLSYVIRGISDVCLIEIASSKQIIDLKRLLVVETKDLAIKLSMQHLSLFKLGSPVGWDDPDLALITLDSLLPLQANAILSSLFPNPQRNVLDFVFDPTSLEIAYWIYGSGPTIFSVEILAGKRISTLRNVIWNAHSSTFKEEGLDPKSLILYKVCVPSEDFDPNGADDLILGDPLQDTKSVSVLFRDVPLVEHLHIVVKKYNPVDASLRAINAVKISQRELFDCLKIQVAKLQSWSQGDVQTNLRNGAQYDFAQDATVQDVHIPEEFNVIERRLSRPRTYKANPEGNDLRNAKQQYPTSFANAFRTTDEQETVRNEREFVTFFNVLRCYAADAPRIDADRSSSLKASTFTVYFIVPPFFACTSEQCSFQYLEQMSWKFPIFISSPAEPMWCKFNPKNDFMVFATSHWIPFVVCEVVSRVDEQDRYRMLVQAIAAARAGQFLMLPDYRFFVVAIYLTKNLIAERYIVMQVGTGDAVSTYRKNFDLKTTSDAVAFFVEMHNLSMELEELAKNLDPSKKERLGALASASKEVLSLNSKTRQGTPKSTLHSDLPSISEHVPGGEESDGLGNFRSRHIQQAVSNIGYNLHFAVSNHPHLARALNRTTRSVEYLKYVAKGGSKEVEILQYLLSFNSLANHTIEAQFRAVEDGTVICMPVAGEWLISLEDPDKQLWSVARQLFEAVGFMHEHRVAHMDIKPHNVLIPPEGGRLTMIDFSTSVRVEDPRKMFKGRCGTPGYIPPEVEAGTYRPLLADLWACGKTLEELCHCTRKSWEQRYLLEIARQLMAKSPDDRPTMFEVLRRMSQDEQPPTMSQARFSPGSTVPFVGVGPATQYQAVNA